MRPPSDHPRRQTGQHRGRVGGRSERVVKAVLAATTAELARVGFVALRVEDVAANAGVNKTTVYRRWPTKVALVGDALRTRVVGAISDPHTGDLRADLAALSNQLVDVRIHEGWAVARVIRTELDDPEVAAVVRDLRESWLAPWLAVVRRAIDAGQLPQGTDPRLLVDVLASGLSFRLRKGEPFDRAHLDAVINLVLRGAEHGGAVVET